MKYNTEKEPDPPPAFTEGLKTLGLEINAPSLQALSTFLDLLLEANLSMNLTAVKDRDEAWTRHLLDSLSLAPFVHPDQAWIDLGAGAGFPSIPLAIAFPATSFTLVEATGKKVAFIRQAAEQLELTNIQVLQERAEKLGHQPAHRDRYDRATARAFAPMPRLLELTLPFLRLHGRLYAMKGDQVTDELDQSRNALNQLQSRLVTIHRPLGPAGSSIPEIEKTAACPNRFPRDYGQIKKSPL